MRNVTRIFTACLVLVSASSMALVQPHVPSTEDAPFRVTTGLLGGLIFEPGFGMNNLGLGIGFSHNVGYDFEYGVAVAGHMAAHDVRLFQDESKDATGFRFEAELMARFMPQVADAFHAGGVVALGYSGQMGDEKSKQAKDSFSFPGALALRLSLAASFGFSDMVSMYFAPGYALTNIYFVKETAEQAIKDKSKSVGGVELPLGLWVAASDNIGVYVEANTRFINVKQAAKSFKEDITVGVSFNM